MDIALQSIIFDLEKRFDCKVLEVQKVHGGRNSRVSLLKSDCEPPRILKQYFAHPTDGRDRFASEINALQYFKKLQIKCVPDLIYANREKNYSVLEYIEGIRISGDDISERHIHEILKFFKAINSEAGSAQQRKFPPAAEAFFSVHGILNNLLERFNRLNDIEEALPENRFELQLFEQMLDYRNEVLNPTLEKVQEYVYHQADLFGIRVDEEIEPSCRALSPSDFGFHNAILHSGRGLVMLDFEYFGEDDPAKTISDFLLHPAVDVPQYLRDIFAGEYSKSFNSRCALPNRLKTVFPIFIFKWSLILLNEFLTVERNRREFADPAAFADRSTLFKKQLVKSKTMLERLPVECRL